MLTLLGSGTVLTLSAQASPCPGRDHIGSNTFIEYYYLPSFIHNTKSAVTMLSALTFSYAIEKVITTPF